MRSVLLLFTTHNKSRNFKRDDRSNACSLIQNGRFSAPIQFKCSEFKELGYDFICHFITIWLIEVWNWHEFIAKWELLINLQTVAISIRIFFFNASCTYSTVPTMDRGDKNKFLISLCIVIAGSQTIYFRITCEIKIYCLWLQIRKISYLKK